MKKNSLTILFLIIFIGTIFSQKIHSEKSRKVIKKREPVQKMESSQDRVRLSEQINFSRQLIRNRNFEGAAAYLETLYERNPKNIVIMNLLRQCYGQLNQLGKSEELLRRFVNQNPNNLNYQIALAEVFSRQGILDSALVYYENAFNLNSEFNTARSQMILQSMISNNFDSQALDFINRWRETLKDSTLFALHRGTLFEKQKKYLNALSEYYPLLTDTTRTGKISEQKIKALLEFEDSKVEVEKYLLKQDDLYNNQRVLTLLSNHYLNNTRYDEAFLLVTLQDSIAGYPGHFLLSYMQQCLNNKFYEQTVRMGDYIFNIHPNPNRVIRAYFYYADAQKQLKEYERAVEYYELAFKSFPPAREKAEALYEIGQIYSDGIKDYDKALIYFDSVLNHYQSGVSFYNSKLAVPYCYIRKGSLKIAFNNFNSLYKNKNSNNIKEEALYNLGLIKFYNKDIDSAKTFFNKLMVEFPRGYFVNDAIKLLSLIDDAEAYPELLYDYSNGLLFEQQAQIDSAVVYLEKLVNSMNNMLADLALFRLGEIMFEKNESTKAVDYFDRLINEYSESYYLPFGLKYKGDILLAAERIDDAREIYLKLLKEYPNYPFISEIRDILRKLENSESA